MQLLDAIPMLETDDVEGTADFYVEKLGFKQHGAAHPNNSFRFR